jgi:hypothetical protein
MFDDSLSYYEALCALNRFIQKNLVEVINNNATVTQEYIRLVDELKEYVEHYFENLDVQEEINNKLDQMAEDGTLQEIVASYLNSAAVWGFDTVADMQAATNLINGSYARTLGFNTINDGGGALYYITDTGTADGKGCIAIGSLYANIVIPTDNKLSIKQIGATTDADIHDYITYLIDKGITCFIPRGTWKTTPIKLSRFNTIRVIGEELYGRENDGGTILTPVADQAYIMKIGYDVATSICDNVTLKNIQFNCTRDNTTYTVNNALELFRIQFSTIDNLSFRSVKANVSALSIIECWETDFGRMMFRVIDAPYALEFGNKIGTGNITTNNFKYMSFEGCRYGCIKFGSNTGYSSNTIGTIDFEDGTATFDDEVRATITSETVYTPYSIIHLENGYNDIAIDNINVNRIAYDGYTSANGNYVRCTDRIFESEATDTGFACISVGMVSGVASVLQPILINANKIDKFYLGSNVFRGYPQFISNVAGCRVFQDNIPDKFRNEYIKANIDRSYRDLVITNNVASCKNVSGRAVRIAGLVTTSDTIYVKAKGTGAVYLGGSDHISWSNEDSWKSFSVTSAIGSSNNLQITSASTDLEVTDYFFA